MARGVRWHRTPRPRDRPAVQHPRSYAPMFTDPPTRQSDPPRVRADLAIHLLGQHTAEAVTMARSVLIVLSCARIRISHPQPAYAALAVWSEALRQCPQVFDQTAPARITAPEAT